MGIDEAIVRADLGRVLVELERLQEEQIKEALTPKEQTFSMTEAEREEALELLRDPQLLDRVARDIGRCGVVGEEVNKVVGYLAATSRKLEAPLGVGDPVVVARQGRRASWTACSSLMPEEHRRAVLGDDGAEPLLPGREPT